MKWLYRITGIFLTVVLALVVGCNGVFAQSTTQQETFEGKITKLIDQKQTQVAGINQVTQQFEVLVTKGSLKNRTIIVDRSNVPLDQANLYKIEEQVVVVSVQNQGNEVFYITDHVRRGPLLFLLILFIGLTLIVARKKGLSGLLGLLVSFLLIFKFILPQISAGVNPIMIAILASALIIPVTFYLSHGFNLKTTVAVGGTLISLIITGILATIFVEATKLTGFSSEEASFLQIAKGGSFNIRGLLLAGIIIGTLGILDDITVSQAAIVMQLKETAKKISIGELYRRAVSVGNDHIASLVNTLILVYTGAALPLLIMFVDAKQPFAELINYEIIAEEIVRTLVSSIGLILAVPITTFLACFVVSSSKSSLKAS